MGPTIEHGSDISQLSDLAGHGEAERLRLGDVTPRARLVSARNLPPPDCDHITTLAVTDLTTAKIRRRKVLGGLIHEYERAT